MSVSALMRGEPMRRTPTDEIDAELIMIAKHRSDALDKLVEAFFAILAADQRTDVLLGRRSAATAAESLRAPMIQR